MRKLFLSLFTLCLLAQFTWADITPSVTLTTYYANIDGKSTDANDNLRVALFNIISSHTKISYTNLQNSVYAASSNPSDFNNGTNKTLEDIYSSYAYVSSDNGSSATGCGQGWNKEHTIPQSWFANTSSDMYCDAHHIFPTDIKMNGVRSNYPYGENSADKECDKGYGHLGTSTFPGYSGMVFDPGEGGTNGSYKGDIARAYFYMVTCYRNKDFTQDNQNYGEVCFSYTNSVAQLTDYMKNLLLKWHREDPVSEKELIRNNAIYAHQKNRNPFVDYPCLAEYIWGNLKGESVNLANLVSGYEAVGTDCCGNSSTPTITVSENALAISAITGESKQTSFTVTGSNLTGNISISKSGSSYITVSPTTIASNIANNTNTITITYNAPSVAGTHTATITISSSGAESQTVSVTATCAVAKTVTWKVNGTTVLTEQVATGGKVSALPSNPAVPSGCDGKTFVGWTATAIDTETDTEPADLFTDIEGSPVINNNTTFHAVFATVSGGSGTSSVTHTFSDKSWSANPSDWTSGKDGNGYTNGQGVQITTGASGANATCPTSYNNVSAVVVNYCTNASKGAGIIAIQIGSTTLTNSISAPSSGGTTLRNSEFDFSSTTPSGTPKIIVTCTTNSIYINSVTITTGSAGTTTGYITSCSTTPITYATVTFYKNDGTNTTDTQQEVQGTTTNLTANTWTREHYTFLGWSANSTATTATYSDGASYTFSADAKLYAVWSEDPTFTVTFISNGSTFFTQTGYAGTSISVDNPSLSNCTDYTFVGWSTSAVETTTSAPTTSQTITSIPDGGGTYYAVYSHTETSQSSGTGGTAEFAPSNFSGQGVTGTGGAISATVNGVTFSCDKGYGATQIRCYSGGTITITSNETITALEYTLSGTYTGGLNTSYTGLSTTNWSQTLSSQARFTSIKVTYGSGTGSSSTTYYTTSPNCGCSITIQASPTEGGTVEFVTNQNN